MAQISTITQQLSQSYAQSYEEDVIFTKMESNVPSEIRSPLCITCEEPVVVELHKISGIVINSTLLPHLFDKTAFFLVKSTGWLVDKPVISV